MNQQPQEEYDPQQPVDKPSSAPGPQIGRRALLRAGAAASPVLLTLVSGPVAAGANGCVVASSFISATSFKSRNAGATKILNCASKTCEQWQTDCGSPSQPWTSYTATTTVSTALGNSGSTYNTWYLNDVLHQPLHTTDQLGVTQHTIAMFLNIKYNGSSFPGVANSIAYLQGMWSNYNLNRGYYIIPGALNWNSTAIVTWLRDLMGDPL